MIEKIIIKKSRSIFIAICIFIFIIFSISIFYRQNKAAINDLEQLISQVEISYNQSKIDNKVTEDLFKEYYLNRAYAIDFILSNNGEENINSELLNKIKNLMEVESIHIIDYDGEVILSSNIKYIGLNLMNSNKSKAFWSLIKSNDKNANVIELDGISMIENKNKIYIGVKSSLTNYSIIQIELDRQVLDDLLLKNSIITIIRNMPTIYERSILLINKDVGNVDSITMNNEQDVIIENVENKDEFLSILNDCSEGKLIKINDKFRYLKTKNIDEYIIAAYVNIDLAHRSIFFEILSLFIGISIILIGIVTIIKYCIRKYILNDISSIESMVKQVMTGNYDIKFETKYDTELSNIALILNDWKDVYKYKSERMTRVMASISKHIATFECLYTINRNFFSDNMQEILGVDDHKWNEIYKNPEMFEEYINYLLEKADKEEKIIVVNNKFLSIISFKEGDQFYGMIMDKTEDEKVKNKIKRELIDKEIESETDPLTKLLNRLGLKKRIKQFLENNNNKGILIIFDLDNFKLVNDELGHPIGDEVLKSFACCLETFFRKNDFIARIGGDEFIVFINSNIDIIILSDKLHCLLENIRGTLKDYYKRYGLSTSIGVVYVDEQRNSYEDLYRDADIALYKAKNLGKDRFYIKE